MVKEAWNSKPERNNYLLYGWLSTPTELSAYRPDPAQVLQLWQIYLDNVDLILKVTHTPTLQGDMFAAASGTINKNPVVEALSFGTYCMAIFSLTSVECLEKFGTAKETLLTRYQYGCQNALVNAEFLRTSDQNCLTALYLYLVSEPGTWFNGLLLMI